MLKADEPIYVSDPIPQLTPEEREEFNRLYEEFCNGLEEDGGVWPIYTGPGD